jgi:hypothetical protein
MRIFLSYRRDDSAPYAGRLADALSQRIGERNVFMDLDSVEPGSDFVEVIERSLSHCDVVLAVISRDWLTAALPDGGRRLDDEDDFVRRELEIALELNVRIVPVLVGGAMMPAYAAMPKSLAPVARRNAFELSDRRWHDDVNKLVERLDRPRSPEVPAAANENGADGGDGAERAGPIAKPATGKSNAARARNKRRLLVAIVSFVVVVGASSSLAVALHGDGGTPRRGATSRTSSNLRSKPASTTRGSASPRSPTVPAYTTRTFAPPLTFAAAGWTIGVELPDKISMTRAGTGANEGLLTLLRVTEVFRSDHAPASAYAPAPGDLGPVPPSGLVPWLEHHPRLLVSNPQAFHRHGVLWTRFVVDLAPNQAESIDPCTACVLLFHLAEPSQPFGLAGTDQNTVDVATIAGSTVVAAVEAPKSASGDAFRHAADELLASLQPSV